ncbi:hypothetical protein BC332_02729 [Capsicum chinense]|nr:hypothetical protein BC332_02729 [Capsicum chinense]
MNRSHQSVENKDLSVSDGEEDHYRKDDFEEEKGPMYDDSYTEEQYTIGPVEVDSGNTGRLRNVVWVHTYCKAAYHDFSDIICFDTIYLMNQWRMPFASFIGVNHYNQFMLLGCALLMREEIKTYAFVFRT